MIRHIVAWNLRDDFTEEENKKHALKIKSELESLKNLIEVIVELKVDINLAPTSSRQIMLNSLFNSESDLADYQIHPDHKRVSGFVGSVTKDRVCLDFNE